MSAHQSFTMSCLSILCTLHTAGAVEQVPTAGEIKSTREWRKMPEIAQAEMEVLFGAGAGADAGLAWVFCG